MELISELHKNGLVPGNIINLTSLKKENSRLYNLLKSSSPKVGSMVSVSRLLSVLGFSTKNKYQYITNLEKKLKKELLDVLTPERIEDAINGGRPLPSLKKLSFSLRYFKAYTSRKFRDKKSSSLKEIINSLYPEHSNLSIYVSKTISIKDFTKEEVTDILLKMYYDRVDISPTALRKFNLPIAKWLNCYYNNKLNNELFSNKRKSDLTKPVSELTGLNSSDFIIKDPRKIKKIGNTSEHYIKVLLAAAKLVDPYCHNLPENIKEAIPTPINEVYPKKKKGVRAKGQKLIFKQDEGKNEELFADFVVKSGRNICVGEVKNIRYITNSNIEIIKKRLEKRMYWRFDDKEIEATKKVLFLLSKKNVLNEVKVVFSDDSIPLVTHHDVKKALEFLLNEKSIMQYMNLNIYSPKEIIEMYNVIVESPHTFVRKSHKFALNYLDMVLKDLYERLQKGKKIEPVKPLKVYSKGDRLIHNKEGIYQHFTLSLGDITELGGTMNHVKQRIKNIPENAIYMDIESTGFVGHLIFLMGIAYKEDNTLKFDLAFARNPWEEKAVLRSFCSKADNKQIVTYNGKTFDYPTIKSRLVANMMKEQLPENHRDVYRIIEKYSGLRKYHKVENLKLSNLCELFGDEREDVPGKEIPLRYNNWITYGKPDPIKRVIEHNVLDLLTLVALDLCPDICGNEYHI